MYKVGTKNELNQMSDEPDETIKVYQEEVGKVENFISLDPPFALQH